MLTPRSVRSPGSRPRSRSGFPGGLTHPLAGACLLAGTVALAAAALAHLTWRLLPQTLAHPERANDEPRMVRDLPLQLALLDHVGSLRNALAAAGAALGLIALILGWPRLAPGWRGAPALGRGIERA